MKCTDTVERRTKTKARSTSIDTNLGRRLRLIRNLKQVSQSQLAKMCGISTQQIQKYENGKNRMSASSLAHISNSLEIDINYFFYDHSFKSLSLINYEKEAKELLDIFFSIDCKEVREMYLVVLKNISENHHLNTHAKVSDETNNTRITYKSAIDEALKTCKNTI